jgi:hypothetical protein
MKTYMSDPAPYPISVRFTRQGFELLDLLMREFGLSRRSVLELAIREKAERHHITLPQPDDVAPVPTAEEATRV